MFYNTLIEFMKQDPAIAATVSTFADEPAIFPQRALESADRPYSIIKIKGRNKSAGVVKAFDVMINYFDFDTSISQCEDFAKAVGDRLDRIHLNTDPDYNNIRLFLSSEGYVNMTDSREINYNLHFTASAGRSGWGEKYANKTQ